MTTEELLKPRYKVIASYPNNEVLVGTKFYKESESFFFPGTDVDKYPHLFRKLSWWEEREEKDMPQYVKMESPFDNLKVGIYEVEKWVQEPNADIWFKLSFDEVGFSMDAVKDCFPATPEEYQAYKSQNNH